MPDGAHQKPTVLDVARAADVAVGTVSRVLNTPDEVRGGLRQQVLDAIDRLGYRPLRRRHGGRNRRVRKGTGNLGIVFLGMHSLAHVPVLAEAMQGVESELISSHENLLMANLPSGNEVPMFLRDQLVDGLIVRCALAGNLRELTHPDLMAAIDRLPHVWLVGKPKGGGGDVVECDLDAVGRIAAEYLASRGHRAAITMDARPSRQDVLSPLETFAFHARERGMQVESLEGSAGDPEPQWPAPAIAAPELLAPMVDRWLALRASVRPGAIVVGTDMAAIPLYAILQSRGLVVGRDVSVVSLRKEQQFATGLEPAPCTIDNAADFMGRLAVRQLRWRFQNFEDTVGTRIRVSPDLIEGLSVASVPS